ncbi:MAG: DUF2911 domain-containing protein [Bernardetiaceae bacterium]|jgi:hypothetical protein|nr:DUF2911 domain-containing protein [Bernardetiaceae bacterium]
MSSRIKKLTIGLLGLAVVVAVAFYSLMVYTKSFSPASTATFDQDGLKLTVKYSQPSKKGRMIFGEAASKAIVPYGKVWRTGANEATVFSTSQALKINGQPLSAGEYSLWTVPGADQWTLIFNQETGQWGTNYNANADVLKVEVPAKSAATPQEMFHISFEAMTGGALMVLAWDETRVEVPIQR